jgi:hypothetical protein
VGGAWAIGLPGLYRVDPSDGARRVATPLDQGRGSALALDANGILHIAGATGLRQFGVSSQALMREVAHYDPLVQAGFAAGLDTRTSALAYSTFLSGESTDVPVAVAADSEGRPIIGGYTWSKSFPLGQALQGYFSRGGFSGFVTRLNADGSGVAGLSTFAGDTRPFSVRGVAAGEDGNVYFAGHTVTDVADGADAFLVKLEPDGRTTDLRLDAVLNDASRTAAAVAPGSLVSLVGDSFRDDARVFFDEFEAPVLYRNWREMLVRVPEGLGAVTAVRVHWEGVETQSVVMPVAPAAPGIYTVDRLGYDAALAWNQDGSRNGRDNPAATGSVITIAVNGLREGVPFTVHPNAYSFPPHPLEVVSVTRERPEGFKADVDLVRVRLPGRMPDYGPMHLYIVSGGEVSRTVPLYAR